MNYLKGVLFIMVLFVGIETVGAAVLPDNDRKNVWAEYMQLISTRRTTTTLLKPELRAAVDAIDTWVNDNASSYNSAIPLPARTSLTQKQKVELLLFIVKRRWEIE